jgi:hypothetical protein
MEFTIQPIEKAIIFQINKVTKQHMKELVQLFFGDSKVLFWANGYLFSYSNIYKDPAIELLLTKGIMYIEEVDYIPMPTYEKVLPLEEGYDTTGIPILDMSDHMFHRELAAIIKKYDESLSQ